jgi:hypothetical protein
LYIGWISPLSTFANLSLPHIKKFQEVLWYCFVCEPHQPYSLNFISSIYLPLLTSTPPPILLSYLSILIPKSMFEGVSQYIPTVNILYSG